MSSGQPVEPSDQHDVAFADDPKQLFQLRAAASCAADLLAVDFRRTGLVKLGILRGQPLTCRANTRVTVDRHFAFPFEHTFRSKNIGQMRTVCNVVYCADDFVRHYYAPPCRAKWYAEVCSVSKQVSGHRGPRERLTSPTIVGDVAPGGASFWERGEFRPGARGRYVTATGDG